MYPDPEVGGFISENLVPVKIHMKENQQAFERFGAHWTPTIIVSDSSGAERYRFEGFLPKEEFLPQVKFGFAKAAFAGGDYQRAASLYQEIVDSNGKSAVAPEAQYWAGVARYKATGDATALQDTAAAFQSRYPDSVWATKASIWQG